MSSLTKAQQELIKKYAIPVEDTQEMPQPSQRQNFLYGAGNELVNIGNTIPEAVNMLAHLVGKKGNLLRYAPQLQGNYDPGSLGYIGGQIAGSIPPMLAGGSLLKGVKAVESLPSLVRAIGAGAAIGGAGAPVGDRTMGSIAGAAGGALGEGAMGAFNLIGPKITKPAIMGLAKKLFAQKYGEAPAGQSMDFAKQIAKVKSALDKNNTENYNRVWSGIENNRGALPSMDETEFPNYMQEVKAIRQKGGVNPFIAYPKNLSKIAKNLKKQEEGQTLKEAFGNEATTEAGGINPQDVHFYKSYLSKLSNYGNPRNTEETSYNILKNALEKDFNNFLYKVNPQSLKDYKYASSYYRDKYAPFVDNPAADKVSKQFNFRNLANIDDKTRNLVLERSDWGGRGGPAQLIKNIIPKKNEDDMSSLYNLGRLTSGEPNVEPKDISPEWLEFAKKRLLNKDTLSVNGEALVDENKMLKAYSNLTDEQKSNYFSAPEKELMDEVVKYDKKNPNKITLSTLGKRKLVAGLGGALGALAGGHIGGPEGALVGFSAASPSLPLLLEATKGSFEKRLPQDTNELLARLQSAQKNRYTPYIPMLAAVGSANTMQGLNSP